MAYITLEQFAELLALKKHFGVNGDEALLRSGVQPETFREVETAWRKSLVASAEREETKELQVFGVCFANERARLRGLAPTLASLGDLPSASASTAGSEPSVTEPNISTPPVVVSVVPHGVEAAPPARFALERPTYLARLAARAEGVDPEGTLPNMPLVELKPPTPFSGTTTPAQLAALKGSLPPRDPGPPSGSVEETLLVRSAPAEMAGVPPPLTQAPGPVPGERARRVEVGTEELPPSEELARLIREADPSIAIARAAALSPPTRDPEPLKPGSRSEHEESGADETLMLISPFIAAAPSTGTFRDAMTPLVVPTLSIADYARFRAALRFHGEEHPATFRIFGVASVEVRDTLQSQFATRFQKDATGQAEFLMLFERYLRALNGGGR